MNPSWLKLPGRMYHDSHLSLKLWLVDLYYPDPQLHRAGLSVV